MRAFLRWEYMSVLVTDRQSYSIPSRREWTDQGYLRVPGRTARVGIQDYLASELGLTDRKPDEIVKVYRPPEEVFSPESLDSYQAVDVTNDHPPDLVSADSFKAVSVGHTLDAAKSEGEYVVADLIIKDANAIKAVQDGKVSLSAGYTAEYHYEPGTTNDGEPYEFVQRNIRINHIALVDSARAGPEARLYDHHHANTSGGHRMSTITLDGKTVEVQDNATAQLIQSAFDASEKSREEMASKVKELEDEAESLKEQMEKTKAEKDSQSEELEKAKQAASDEAIAERLKRVSEIKDAAAKVAGAQFTCDSVNPDEIKRAALAQARPTVDWADKSDHYVQAAWDMAVESADNDPAGTTHQRFADDLKNHYSNDAGQMIGSQAYNEFLSGGKH